MLCLDLLIVRKHVGYCTSISVGGLAVETEVHIGADPHACAVMLWGGNSLAWVVAIMMPLHYHK